MRGTVRVYLLRHGESWNNAGPHPVPDAPLTPRGRRQAERVLAAWPDQPLEVVVSPLWRALETAEPLVSRRRVPVQGWPELVEWNRSFPTEGRSPAEVRARFPWARFSPSLEAVGWPAYPGPETEEAARARAAAVIRRVGRTPLPDLPEDGAARVLVGHQGFHGLLLAGWLGVPSARFRLDNVRAHILDLAADRVLLVGANVPLPWDPGRGEVEAMPPSPAGRPGDVYLIRHGQSTANLTGARVYDPPLTDHGHAQAAALARALRARGVRAVLSSPLVRALETAAPVAAAAAAPLHVWADLVEFNRWDAYTTRSAADVRRRFPQAQLEGGFPEEGARFPGPEPAAAGWARAARVWARVLRLGTLGPVAVVAHGTFLGMVLATALGMEPEGPVALQRDNAAVDHLRWEGEHTTVLTINDVSHLPAPANG